MHVLHISVSLSVCVCVPVRCAVVVRQTVVLHSSRRTVLRRPKVKCLVQTSAV